MSRHRRDAERGDRATRNAGQAKKSDCVCPKKPAPRGKKKSKLPKTDEPLEAIESRFLGEDDDERELEACRESVKDLEKLEGQTGTTKVRLCSRDSAPPCVP